MTQNGDSLPVLNGGRQMLLCVFVSRHDLKLLQAHMTLSETLSSETCVTVRFCFFLPPVQPEEQRWQSAHSTESSGPPSPSASQPKSSQLLGHGGKIPP